MKKIIMKTKAPYDIFIEDNILDKLSTYIFSIYKGKNIYIITDKRVASFYLNRVDEALKDQFEVKSVIIEGYEEAKSLSGFQEVVDKLLEYGVHRSDMLVALGGGVIGDLVGFVASTLYRGLPYIQIPTTLLSMVDSSIGGKTAIDYKGMKNIIGAFKQPNLVLIDPKTLETLPERELKNGYGEVIKHALIYSKKLWDMLKQKSKIDEEIIYQNLIIKQHFVEADEFDKNERMKLNFGHTFGHVIELKDHLLHGEAVLSGILCSLDLGAKLNINSKELKEEVLKLYRIYKLNYLEYDYHELLNDILMDKKNVGGIINFIFVDKIGNSLIYPVDEEKTCEL